MNWAVAINWSKVANIAAGLLVPAFGAVVLNALNHPIEKGPAASSYGVQT